MPHSTSQDSGGTKKCREAAQHASPGQSAAQGHSKSNEVLELEGEPRVRLPTILNWTLLFVNIMVLMVLLMLLLAPPSWMEFHSAPRRISEDQTALGMELYWEKGPFCLLAHRDFPETNCFSLIQKDGGASFSVDDLRNNAWAIDSGTGATDSASIYVGEHFSLSCEYSGTGQGMQVAQFSVHLQKDALVQSLVDLNADGIFDMRTRRKEERMSDGHLEVRYDGDWRQVMGGDKDTEQNLYRKTLLDGTRVVFDKPTGKWKGADE
jgi:hypothetical protein